jgi:ATP synthase in type III secretion protein N
VVSASNTSNFATIVDRAFTGARTLVARGRIVEAVGGLIKATGLQMRVGETCEIRDAADNVVGVAEAIGFSAPWTFLSPLGHMAGISPALEAVPLGVSHQVRVGPALRGRVLDGYGKPIDGKGDLSQGTWVAVDADPPSPITRLPIAKPLVTGVKALDSLLMCGVGQRLAVVAPPAAGKSTLLSLLSRQCVADTVVVALVGERGREVGEFIRSLEKSPAKDRMVIVAATSDRPALERVKAAMVATAIAESFRDQGQHVLLVVDSLTRLARAQREIGLAMGEPPTRRGFPPSVFALLPRLLERSGPSAKGAITAFYAVLVEGEQLDDPVGEEVKAILDGHVSLSPELAASGHYPAIDVLASVSRLMENVASAKHKQLASHVRQLMARYKEIELLVRMGEFKAGLDPVADQAVASRSALLAFLKQGREETHVNMNATLQALSRAIAVP